MRNQTEAKARSEVGVGSDSIEVLHQGNYIR